MTAQAPFDIIVQAAQERVLAGGTEKASQQDVLIAVIGWQTEKLQRCFSNNQKMPFTKLVGGGGIGAGLVLGAYEAMRRLFGVQ